MKRTHDFPLIPTLLFNALALAVMWFCRGDVAEADASAVLLYQLIVLLVGNECWAWSLAVPAIAMGFKKMTPEEEYRRMRRWVRLTSPAMFAAPLLAGFVLWIVSMSTGADGAPAWLGAVSGQTWACLAGFGGLFVLDLFKPVLPLEVLSFLDWDPDAAPKIDPDEFQRIKGDIAGAVPEVEVLHSEWYERHAAEMARMLKPGEKVLLATSPHVASLRRYSPAQKETGVWVGSVLLGLFSVAVAVAAAGLEGWQSVAAFAGAGIGAFLTANVLRSIVSGRREARRRDYFITSERYCRFSAADSPVCIEWKDVDKAGLSLLDGSDIGNIHLERKSVFSKAIGALFGGKAVEVSSSTEGHLDGLECVPSAAALYSLICAQLGDRTENS